MHVLLSVHRPASAKSLISVLLADAEVPFPSPELTLADGLTQCAAWHTGGQRSLDLIG